MTRGERNRNPGNIRQTDPPIKWEGLVGQDDDGFCQFRNMAFGVRAAAKNIMTYRDRHGLTTVRGIITRWAPPSENNTSRYVDNVASWMEVDPDEQLEWPKHWIPLLSSLFRQEGFCPPEKQIIEGLRLAGVPGRRVGGLGRSRTVRNATLSASLGTISLGTVVNGFISKVSDVDWRTGLAIVGGVIGILLVLNVIRYRAQDEADWNP